HTVVVGDDHVSWMDRLAGADDGYVDVAEGLFDRPVGGDTGGPDREAHLPQLGDVPAAGIDDHTTYAPGGQRRGDEVADVAGVGARGWRDDQHVTVAALLDRDVDHPVVAGWDADRHRRAGDVRAGIDRPQVRGEQAGAGLCFVHGGDTEA